MEQRFLDRMAEIKAAREPKGFNVHFINERGERDVFSFRSAERANAFRDGLRRLGREILEGN